MKKLEVSDIIKIKSLNWYNKSKNRNEEVGIKTKSESYINFKKEMTKFCGKKYKITYISFCKICKEEHFSFDGELGNFYWTIGMFDLDKQLEFDFNEKA